MSNKWIFVLVGLYLIALSCSQKNAPPYIEIYAEEGRLIIDKDAHVEKIATGFTWTEGPLYVPQMKALLFSDIPNNKIYKWTEKEGAVEYLFPAGQTNPKSNNQAGSNGLLLDNNGQLVLCQHGDRRISILESSMEDPSPNYSTIIDKYQGRRLNSPNDAIYHSNGDLYFTDPPYGLPDLMDDAEKELNFQGVYRLSKEGELTLLIDDLKFPNGITLSADEKTLYVGNSDWDNLVWMQYDVLPNGNVTNAREFYNVRSYADADKSVGTPDGMKVNKNGIVFAPGPEGLFVFNRNGELLAKVITGHRTSNCALSEDEKYIFLTAHQHILRIPLK